MTLKEALQIVVKDECLGDSIYNVREHAMGDGEFEGNSWDHPRVKRFSDAVQRLEEELSGVAKADQVEESRTHLVEVAFKAGWSEGYIAGERAFRPSSQPTADKSWAEFIDNFLGEQ